MQPRRLLLLAVLCAFSALAGACSTKGPAQSTSEQGSGGATATSSAATGAGGNVSASTGDATSTSAATGTGGAGGAGGADVGVASSSSGVGCDQYCGVCACPSDICSMCCAAKNKADVCTKGVCGCF